MESTLSAFKGLARGQDLPREQRDIVLPEDHLFHVQMREEFMRMLTVNV